MPEGIPTPEKLIDEKVTFFSLDTDVIQAAGFNFNQGALHQLPIQLPHSMRLQFTEVVLKEVISHRLNPVKEALGKFQGAITGIKITLKKIEIP